MKTIKYLVLMVAALTMAGVRADDWRKVAFVGDAKVKTISGLVEVMDTAGDQILHPGETARAGQTLRVWRGAEVVLWMETSQSFVRAAGPVLLRLAPANEGYDRASIDSNRDGFEVRAVRGGGKYLDAGHWRPLRTGMTLPEGSRVRPFRDSTLDFYNPGTHTALRVTDHSRQTTLSVGKEAPERILASKAP